MISFQSHSGIYTLEVKQILNISLNEAWDFFSSPANLSKITPKHMGFIITSGTPGKMHPGQIITYKVSPIAGINLNWMTEITHVKESVYFIDEQRFGPYSLWHHQHHFKAIDGGTEMTDIVHYKLPLGFLGDLAHTLFVKKQLQEIFDFRFKKAEELFGKWNG